MEEIDPAGVQLIVLVPAVLALGSALGGIDLETVDFRSFYDAAFAWRTGVVVSRPAGPVPAPNLNAPTWSLLMAPLTLIPFKLAFVLFTCLGLASLVASFRAIQTRLALTEREWIWVSLAVIGSMPCLMVWVCGQLTWVLLYPVTRAWLASTPVRAGLWLSLAIAVKPPLALMAVVLPWRIWMVAAVSTALITAGVVLMVGAQPWIDWISLAGSVNWLGTPMNVSFIGTAARLQAFDTAGLGLADLNRGALVLTALIGSATFAVAIRAQGDRRWTLALIWSLLISPLGWIYYLPLAIGPMLSSWPARRRTVLAALVCLSIPVGVLLPAMRWSLFHWPTGFVIASSVYTAGALFAWWAWSDAAANPRSRSAGS